MDKFVINCFPDIRFGFGKHLISVFHHGKQLFTRAAFKSVSQGFYLQVKLLLTQFHAFLYRCLIQPLLDHSNPVKFIFLKQVGQFFGKLPEPCRIVRTFVTIFSHQILGYRQKIGGAALQVLQSAKQQYFKQIIVQHFRIFFTGIKLCKHAPQAGIKVLKINIHEYRMFCCQKELQPFGQICIGNNHHRSIKYIGLTAIFISNSI